MATLTLIAGPNGAGKTSFSDYFVEQGLLSVSPVDMDSLEKLINWDKIPDDPLRYERERRKEIDRVFREICNDAIEKRLDFAFECNLRKDQIQNVGLFENAGYELNLIYIWLDNIEISEKRVQKRVQEGGHFVGKENIYHNYKEGLENLDLSYADWHNLYVFDNSIDVDSNPEQDFTTLLLWTESGKIIFNQLMEKENIREKLPKITEQIITEQ